MNNILLLDPAYEDLKQTPIAQWVAVLHSASNTGYLHIRGKDCMVALEPCPDYSNRGRWLAKLEIFDEIALNVDWADGWQSGRYYFFEDCAKRETEAWLRARGQIEESNP